MRVRAAARTTLTVGLVLGVATAVAGPVSAASATAPPVRQCAGLTGAAIPADTITLATTGGQVTEAVVVAASGAGATAVGEYCRVSAALHPVDPTAPDIHLQVALPTAWNEQVLMFGGGGYNGTIPAVTGNVPFGPADALTPLGRGYATFASDSGHQATPGFVPSSSLDGSFLSNDEALRNFSGDALKKTSDAARYLVRSYYGRSPQLAYFAGGSTGGREALAVVQRFPRAFDGVISVYPAYNAASLDLYFGYIAQQLSRPGAFPRPAQQALLYTSVMAACDPLDGLVDGVISNEAGCHFDPVVLRCPDGSDAGDTCLSDVQIAAIRAISSPVTFPYRTAAGPVGYPGFPFLSGANMTTPLLGLGTTAPASPMPTTSGYGVQFWDQWVRYAVTRDPSYNSLTLDPLAPGALKPRITELVALQDVDRADLSAFAGHGGKLLLVHGTADELVSHRATVEYYRRVIAKMGAGPVRDFSRLYLVPGANHANVAPAFAAGWDSLTALDRWVTTGAAPTDPVVTDKRPGATRTRPLCEWPTYPRYNGAGDVDAASSFTCVTATP